jgi:nucleotide-binding universal stress UspA family protein
VTVVARAKTAEGDPPAPARTYTFVLGKQDSEKKKINVRLDGWPRVNVVDDAVVKLIDRPALAYRGRRLFDTAETKLTELAVGKGGAESFAIKQNAAPATGWKLTKPVASDADETKASQIVGDLARLEAVEFVNDAPKPEDLTKYGLDKPRLTADLTFSGTGAKPAKLDAAILDLGGQVAAALGGKLHAVHAFVPTLLDVRHLDLDDPNLPATIEARAAQHARAGFDRALAGADVPAPRRHLVARHPVDAIPETAKAVGAGVVVMGAVSRSGLKRLTVGDTAEQILDSLARDVLIVKPSHFAARVPPRKRGVQLIASPGIV